MSYSKLQSMFRLTGPLLIFRGRFSLKQFQAFPRWSAFSFSNVPFAFLFMPPSSLSAPQQPLLCCRREQRTNVFHLKKQNKKASSCFPALSSPALQPSATLPTTYNFALFSHGLSLHLQQVWQAAALWLQLMGFSGTCHHETPQHLWWHQWRGGAGGHTQPLCSCPDSCCNHTSKPGRGQVPRCIPQQWCIFRWVTCTQPGWFGEPSLHVVFTANIKLLAFLKPQ